MRTTLEDRLREDPTDPQTQLILGDLLQQEGDPRGELIALAASGGEVEAFRAAHADALLGGLARVPPGQADLVWHYGYLRDATLRSDTAEGLAELVQTLVDSPASTLLMGLTLEGPADYEPALDRLEALGRPVTLRHLSGPSIDLERFAALQAVFPQLSLAPAPPWEALVQKMRAAKGRLKHPFDTSRITAPEFAHPALVGSEIDLDLMVIGLRVEIEKKKPFGLLAGLRELFTPSSLDRFALSLLLQWSEASHDGAAAARKLVVGFDTAARIGGPQCADFLFHRVGGRAKVIEALDRMASPEAFVALSAFARQQRFNVVPQQARQVLEEHAGPDGIEALLDRCDPRFPDPRRAHEAELARWEELMVDGHRIPADVFKRFTLQSPYRQALARPVVWGLFDGEQLVSAVRVDGDRLVDLDGEAHELRGTVGVLHPIELGPDGVKAWAEVIPDNPEWQLARTVATPGPQEAGRRNWKRGSGSVGQLLTWNSLWESGATQFLDGQAEPDVVTVHRTFPRDGARVTVGRDRHDDGLLQVYVAKGSVSELHPVTQSEILTALAGWAPPISAEDLAPAEGEALGKGHRVVFVKPRSKAGTAGEIFWEGPNKYGEGKRFGVRGDDGETYWGSEDQVVAEAEYEPAETPEPTKPKKPPAEASDDSDGDEDEDEEDDVFEKGDTVEIVGGKKGVGQSGTIFWIGENKWGKGLRYGVKGEDGETYWVDGKNLGAPF